MSLAFYNDNNPYCCEWLENLIQARIIPYGIVECCSIKSLKPDRLARYTQVHLFAGMGGWAYALRLAKWPDERPIWTGSCPCQPFSVAGKGKGRSDKRHLWPHMYRLIRNTRPTCVMGEQVAGAAGYAWFDGVRANLEKESFEARTVDIPACSVNAPHIRQRLYWVARLDQSTSTRRSEARSGKAREVWNEARGEKSERRSGNGVVVHSKEFTKRESQYEVRAESRGEPWVDVGGSGARLDNSGLGNSHSSHLQQIPPTRQQPQHELDPRCNSGLGFWDHSILIGPDPSGFYRRAQPGICLLVDGLSNRIPQLGALGNSINPILAAQVILAYMEVYPYP